MKGSLRNAGLIALWLLAALAHGDGIPVTPDLKQVTCEHLTFRLEGDQVAQVERLRKVTLTDAQLRQLQSIYTGSPRTLEVLSSRWDSCMCGFGVIAIWCRPGEVDIPTYGVKVQKEIDEYEAKNPSPPEEGGEDEGPTTTVSGTDVKLDSKGRMFIKGKEIQEAELYAVIDGKSEPPPGSAHVPHSVHLDTPPPIDKETDARIRALSNRIDAYCKERRVEYWAQGFSAGE